MSVVLFKLSMIDSRHEYKLSNLKKGKKLGQLLINFCKGAFTTWTKSCHCLTLPHPLAWTKTCIHLVHLVIEWKRIYRGQWDDIKSQFKNVTWHGNLKNSDLIAHESWQVWEIVWQRWTSYGLLCSLGRPRHAGRSLYYVTVLACKCQLCWVQSQLCLEITQGRTHNT